MPHNLLYADSHTLIFLSSLQLAWCRGDHCSLSPPPSPPHPPILWPLISPYDLWPAPPPDLPLRPSHSVPQGPGWTATLSQVTTNTHYHSGTLGANKDIWTGFFADCCTLKIYIFFIGWYKYILTHTHTHTHTNTPTHPHPHTHTHTHTPHTCMRVLYNYV